MTAMSTTTARRLLNAGVALFVVFAIVTLVQSRAYEIPILIANGTFVAVGGLIVVRRPGNTIGLALVAYGATWAVITAAIITAETLDEAGHIDAAAWMTLLSVIPGAFGIWLIGATWLLFPDGRTSTPTDRKLLWGSGLFAAVLTVVGVFGTPQSLPETKPYPHPFIDDEVAKAIFDAVSGIFLLLFFFAIYVAVRLIRRMRHGDPTERRQVLWIAVAVILYVVILMFNVAVAPLGTDDRAFWLIDAVAIVMIPLGIAVAIFRHGLFDIDVIVSKSVMYLGLLAAVTAVYALIVVVPLLLIGTSDDGGPGLLLPIVATAVVALLFEPIRSRMQRWANRLVYGNRSTPHQVLSQVTSRLGESEGTSTDDLARLIAEGTGAEHAVVWLVEGDDLGVAGSWSVEGSDPTLPAGDDDRSAMVDVLHEAERLGAVSITKPRNDAITPADRELLDDVAAGAGLLLRNIRLNKELEDRAAEVRDSRQRLIEAQDEERHRLERDLHDGAQQQVVALKVKLGIAKTIAEREGSDEIATRLVALADETQEAVDALRAVAHGIYPPLLESEGLEPALRAVERTSALPIELDAADLERYGRSTEATVYFCVTETLERARMSGATQARVEVAGRNGDLITRIDLGRLEAELDLRAVADRLDAAGGILTVGDQAERGRYVVGSLPVTHIDGATP